MSTSLSRSSGSTATSKVIGWSLPITFVTAAKPSNESPRETRSTAPLSTRNVSTPTPGPKSRAIEAASLPGGADCAPAARAASTSPSAPSISRKPRGGMSTSELVADPQAQDLRLARSRPVAQQPVVGLEDGVVGRLVGKTERADASGEGLVLRGARRRSGLGVIALVARERVELLCRRRGERPQ